jgi:hypothetical protein
VQIKQTARTKDRKRIEVVTRRRVIIPEWAREEFRITSAEKIGFQILADFIVRTGERGQRGATKSVLFGWLCSQNPELLHRVADRIHEYANSLEGGTKKDKTKKGVDARRRSSLDSIQPAACEVAIA